MKGFLEATIVEKDKCDICIAQEKIKQGAEPNPEELILNKTRATSKVSICLEHHAGYNEFHKALREMEAKIKDMFGDNPNTF